MVPWSQVISPSPFMKHAVVGGFQEFVFKFKGLNVQLLKLQNKEATCWLAYHDFRSTYPCIN